MVPFKRQSLCGEDLSVEEEENLASGSKPALSLTATISGAIEKSVLPAGQCLKARFKRYSKEGTLRLKGMVALPTRPGLVVSVASIGGSEGVKEMSVRCEEDMITFGNKLYKSVLDKYSKFIASKNRKKNISDREVAEFAWTTEVFDVMYKAADGDVALKMAAIRFEKQCRMDFINRLLLHSHEYSAYEKRLFKFTLECKMFLVTGF